MYNTNAEKDESFGDGFINISKTKKRLVRATIKNYDNTGTYIFLKVFKNTNGTDQLTDYRMHHQISLTSDEFDRLMCQSDRVRYFSRHRPAQTTSDADSDKENNDPTLSPNSNINL